MFLPKKGCDLFVDKKFYKHNAIFFCIKYCALPLKFNLKRGQLQQQNYYNKNHGHLCGS